MAAENGDTEIVKALLEKGADVHSVDTTRVSIHEEIYNHSNS